MESTPRHGSRFLEGGLVRSGTAGFTIIELIIVIAVIGILATVALPKFQDLSQAARIAATKGSLGAVRSVLSIKYAQSATGGGAASYPSSITSADFADNQEPKNSLIGATAGVAAVTAVPNGTTRSATAGFWYVSGTGAAAGRAGAYSGGTVDGDTDNINTAPW